MFAADLAGGWQESWGGQGVSDQVLLRDLINVPERVSKIEHGGLAPVGCGRAYLVQGLRNRAGTNRGTSRRITRCRRHVGNRRPGTQPELPRSSVPPCAEAVQSGRAKASVPQLATRRQPRLSCGGGQRLARGRGEDRSTLHIHATGPQSGCTPTGVSSWLRNCMH